MYPVECTIPYDEGSGKLVQHYLNTLGEWVKYDPNPQYDDRRIVFLKTMQAQQEALKKNPSGEFYFIVPTDVINEQTRNMIRAEVDARLRELGIRTEGGGSPLSANELSMRSEPLVGGFPLNPRKGVAKKYPLRTAPIETDLVVLRKGE